MAKQEISCPWCGVSVEKIKVKAVNKNKASGKIVERRCPACGKVLSAYLESEGGFLPRIRTF